MLEMSGKDHVASEIASRKPKHEAALKVDSILPLRNLRAAGELVKIASTQRESVVPGGRFEICTTVDYKDAIAPPFRNVAEILLRLAVYSSVFQKVE